MKSSFVVDASVAMAWCFQDEATDATRALLLRMSREAAVVPSLWFLEVANVLATAERRGRINPSQSAEFIRLVGRLDLEIDEHAEHRSLTHVLDLARAHKLSAYDAAYLDLAQRWVLPLASCDRALRLAATTLGIALIEL